MAKTNNTITFGRGSFLFLMAFMFVFGLILRNNTPEVQEKIVEKVVTENIEVCSNEADWERLKDIDDEALMLASDGFGAVSEIFDAQSRLAFEEVDLYIGELDIIADQMMVVANERLEVLDRLGY